MKLLAIDGNSVLNRAYYGISHLSTKSGIPTNAVVGFLNILIRLENLHKPDAVAIAFDVSRTTHRNAMYAEYKANRKGMPDDLREQLPIVKELLCYMGYKLATAEGYEGDDVLGTLARCCCEQGNECIVATGDRDCLQLVTDCVSVSLLKNKEDIIYTPKKMLEDYGFEPIHIIDLKALMGDSSDNIPGVRGIGEKTADSLIRKYKTLENVYANLDKIEKKRTAELLENGRESANLSKQLATIKTDAPIETDIAGYIRGDGDRQALGALLTKLEMTSFISKLKIDNLIITPAEPQEEKTVSYSIRQTPPERLSKAAVLLNADGSLTCCDKKEIFSIPPKNCDSFLRTLADDNTKIYTFSAKELIKRFISLDCSFSISFDAELAAYLLNPLGSGYTINGVKEEYISGIKIDTEDEYKDAAALIPICECLEKRLENEGMKELFDKIEMPLCRVLAQMEFEGFQIDAKGLEKFGEQLKNDIELTREQIIRLAGVEFNINSTRELGNVLFERLSLPHGKKTKTGYSTAIEVLEELMDKHEIVPQIFEYRKLTKLYSTYVVGLLKAVSEDGRIHSTFNQTETRTGRISSLEPNVQNIPVRTSLGSEMRRFFVAREGYTLIDADYSQIELRILAHIADDKAMKQAFLDNVDIHAVTASQVFNTPLETLPHELRSRAKAINFGIVYGISPYSLSKDINVSMREAKEYIEAYLKTYSGVAAYMKKIVAQAQLDGYVSTIYGRRRALPEINSKNKNLSSFAERVALNAPIQGTAADIIKLAMIKVCERIEKEAPDARLILQVHDELIVEAPVMQAELVKKLVVEEMENAAAISVPLKVDANIGKDWYTSK